MKKRIPMKAIGISLFPVLLVLALMGCSSAEPAEEPTEAPPAATSASGEVEETQAAEGPTAPEASELEGDPVRGGQLYDTWWAVVAEAEEDEHSHDEHEDAAGAPEGDHPLWATQTTNERSGPDTWRCKECHGWDYKGADGAYGSGSHFTGFPGVFGSKDKDQAEILAAMHGSTNPDHDFST